MLKLPVLFEHYKEHKKENKDVSALQFLSMHYLQGSPKDKDYDRDMQLPFKSSGDCLSVVSPAYIPVAPTVPVIKPLDVPPKEKITLQNLHLLSPHLSAIWQPPQSC